MDKLSFAEFDSALQAGDIAEVVVIRPEEELNFSSLLDKAVLEDTKKALNARSGWQILRDPSDPYFPLLKEYGDVVSREPPTRLPPDRGVCHEIDLVPGTKYCVTRQWPLIREQCDVIDKFFRAKHAAGMVRESKSPHSTPTYCVKKPNGKWQIVHAYYKLNTATIPAQTPISSQGCSSEQYGVMYDVQCRDVRCTVPSTSRWILPLHTRDSDILLTAGVCTDDIFVHSRAENGKTDVENHIEHMRAVITCTRMHKLYANIDKCIFGAEEIRFLECFIGKRGIRTDPVKVKAIVDWLVPRNQKDLRKWLGLANYLHKHSHNYAEGG
ncbi:unnamed protein product [Peronospora belbahrii]|uniref:Reverse transcriptase n=1 Tax=Peronospora belbahrii TaxID=622444 RepID=A0ABN8CKR6_9STRA|nr:unnamed protein product [Peronospora belbahrii]